MYTKTIDVDPGVTPFVIPCSYCGSHATSSHYKDLIPSAPVTVEWYRPSLEETLKLANDFNVLDHVLLGGLLRRKIEPGNAPFNGTQEEWDALVIKNRIAENKILLYKKLQATRLEVDNSIVDNIKLTVDAIFKDLGI